MARIHDVAKLARVHISTVSRVVSRPEVVAPTTRRRVLRAIKALQYQPNSIAKSLRMCASGKLLVITPDLTNAIFSLVLGGIEDAANRAGYAVLLGYTAWGDEAREDRYSRMMMNREADGLIFLSPRVPKAAESLVRAAQGKRAPVVNVLSCARELGIPSVHIDNEKAAYQAMDHLYSLGHRDIAVITGPTGSKVTQDRLRGVRARARKAGIKAELPVAADELSAEGGRVAAEQLLARTPRPTALFCTKDEMAFGAIECVRQHGLRIPEDVSVVGFDDIPFARYTDPPLTTVAQPMHDIGKTAVKLLFDVIDGQSDVPLSVVLPHQLVVRGTTGRPKQMT